jgi:hypothetical protein
MVSGIALLDYNNDGLLDIYAVNGAAVIKRKMTIFVAVSFRKVPPLLIEVGRRQASG